MVRASTRVRSGSHAGGGARTDDGYDPKRNKAPQDGGGLLKRLIAWVAGHHIPMAQLLQITAAGAITTNLGVAWALRRALSSDAAAYGWLAACTGAAGLFLYKHGHGIFGLGPMKGRKLLAALRRDDLPAEKRTRFVVISDTHNAHDQLGPLPDADVLLHCGDMTYRGTAAELTDFNRWLGEQRHIQTRLVIAGNHDIGLDKVSYEAIWQDWHEDKEDPAALRSLLTNCTLLQDEAVQVKGGFKVWGSPFQPGIPGRRMAFNLADDADAERTWSAIPRDADVVMTHGPAFQLLDRIFAGSHVGDKTLRRELLERVQPRYHCCGHIHEAWGVEKTPTTVFINAACCTLLYKVKHEPIVFDIPIDSS